MIKSVLKLWKRMQFPELKPQNSRKKLEEKKRNPQPEVTFHCWLTLKYDNGASAEFGF